MTTSKQKGSYREQRRRRIVRIVALPVVLLFVAWAGYLLNQSNITYITLNGRTWKYREYRFTDHSRIRNASEAIIVMALRARGYQRETMAFDPFNRVWMFRKEITAQPGGPANGSQPMHSETNPRSSAASLEISPIPPRAGSVRFPGYGKAACTK